MAEKKKPQDRKFTFPAAGETLAAGENEEVSKQATEAQSTAMAEPAFTNSAPPLKKRGRKTRPGFKRISGFDIDEKTFDRIAAIARREFRTPSMQVQKLIVEGLEFEESHQLQLIPGSIEPGSLIREEFEKNAPRETSTEYGTESGTESGSEVIPNV